MDKKLIELKQIFENDMPVSFTAFDKQAVLAKIKQNKEKPKRRINHFLPTVISSVMIMIIFLIFNHHLVFLNGHTNEGVRSKILLENVMSNDGDEYRFEEIPWFSTKQELIDSDHIPSNFDDLVTVQADGESIMLNDNITFKDPPSEAKVIYKFQYDLFIGGEYIIITENDDDLIKIAKDLKNKLSEQFPEPIEGTLDGLSEETIRGIHHGGSRGASWWKGDNNIEYSSFEIRITKNENGEGIIGISVSPPELPEELKENLIEKGYLLPQDDEAFQEIESVNETTYETTIECSDELLHIYNQYKVSLDDFLLKDLIPIDIFKLYHHAVQMDHQEVVYALFIHDGTYDIPNKETYPNDIASVDDEIMKENNRKYYEVLIAVKEFNEVYMTDHEAVITYLTDSSEYDQMFQLIKDKHTDVWKVSWLPIQ